MLSCSCIKACLSSSPSSLRLILVIHETVSLGNPVLFAMSNVCSLLSLHIGLSFAHCRNLYQTETGGACNMSMIFYNTLWYGCRGFYGTWLLMMWLGIISAHLAVRLENSEALLYSASLILWSILTVDRHRWARHLLGTCIRATKTKFLNFQSRGRGQRNSPPHPVHQSWFFRALVFACIGYTSVGVRKGISAWKCGASLTPSPIKAILFSKRSSRHFCQVFSLNLRGNC